MKFKSGSDGTRTRDCHPIEIREKPRRRVNLTRLATSKEWPTRVATRVVAVAAFSDPGEHVDSCRRRLLEICRATGDVEESACRAPASARWCNDF